MQNKEIKKQEWFTAIRNDDIKKVKEYIKNGWDVNIQDNYGDTALILASYKGYSDIVKFLIKVKADINAKDNDGYTALMWASRKIYPDIVQLLIDASADVNIKNDDGDTALALLFHYNKNYVIVKMLQEAEQCKNKNA